MNIGVWFNLTRAVQTVRVLLLFYKSIKLQCIKIWEVFKILFIHLNKVI